MKRQETSRRTKWLLLTLPGTVALVILLVGYHFFSTASLVSQSSAISMIGAQITPQTRQDLSNGDLFNGSVPSLSWIVGRDCKNGMQAYLQNAATNPDAALVGTGWLDPTTGKLINGESNNCVQGSLSMDSVIQSVHQHGGKAYLTIAMQTDGTSDAWTTAQQTAYVVQAVQSPALLQPILAEVQRGNYDGVIMDLEGTDNFYPGIQQTFATYNQQLWHALTPLHKLYGIALIHKVSDHDEYFTLNGFENWNLLGKSADFLVVMAVDQSYWTPGPSVSVPWLQQLLAYTLQTMPQMLGKVVWELPLYGNSWHQADGQWVFDDIIDYGDALQIVESIPQGQVDQTDSKLDDAYQPHLVYTDSSGIKHSLWYMNALSLQSIMRDFQKILQQQPQVAHGNLQFAVWWRTTAEPPGFWPKVDELY